ncbi:5-hydroxytryptamine receptor 1, partial [Fragariocoptes setiger]
PTEFNHYHDHSFASSIASSQPNLSCETGWVTEPSNLVELDPTKDISDLITSFEETRAKLKCRISMDKNLITQCLQLLEHDALTVKEYGIGALVPVIKLLEPDVDRIIQHGALYMLGTLALVSATARDELIKHGIIDLVHSVIDRQQQDEGILHKTSRLIKLLVSIKKPCLDAETSLALLKEARYLISVAPLWVTVTNGLEAINLLLNQKSMLNFYDLEVALQLMNFLDNCDGNVVDGARAALLSLIAQPRLNGKRDATFIKDYIMPKLIAILKSGANHAGLHIAMIMLDGLIYINCDHAHSVVTDDKSVQRLKELAQTKNCKNCRSTGRTVSRAPDEVLWAMQVAGVIKKKCPKIYSQRSVDLDSVRVSSYGISYEESKSKNVRDYSFRVVVVHVRYDSEASKQDLRLHKSYDYRSDSLTASTTTPTMAKQQTISSTQATTTQQQQQPSQLQPHLHSGSNQQHSGEPIFASSVTSTITSSYAITRQEHQQQRQHKRQYYLKGCVIVIMKDHHSQDHQQANASQRRQKRARNNNNHNNDVGIGMHTMSQAATAAEQDSLSGGRAARGCCVCCPFLVQVVGGRAANEMGLTLNSCSSSSTLCSVSLTNLCLRPQCTSQFATVRHSLTSCTLAGNSVGCGRHCPLAARHFRVAHRSSSRAAHAARIRRRASGSSDGDCRHRSACCHTVQHHCFCCPHHTSFLTSRSFRSHNPSARACASPRGSVRCCCCYVCVCGDDDVNDDHVGDVSNVASDACCRWRWTWRRRKSARIKHRSKQQHSFVVLCPLSSSSSSSLSNSNDESAQSKLNITQCCCCYPQLNPYLSETKHTCQAVLIFDQQDNHTETETPVSLPPGGAVSSQESAKAEGHCVICLWHIRTGNNSSPTKERRSMCQQMMRAAGAVSTQSARAQVDAIEQLNVIDVYEQLGSQLSLKLNSSCGCGANVAPNERGTHNIEKRISLTTLFFEKRLGQRTLAQLDVQIVHQGHSGAVCNASRQQQQQLKQLLCGAGLHWCHKSDTLCDVVVLCNSCHSGNDDHNANYNTDADNDDQDDPTTYELRLSATRLEAEAPISVDARRRDETPTLAPYLTRPDYGTLTAWNEHNSLTTTPEPPLFADTTVVTSASFLSSASSSPSSSSWSLWASSQTATSPFIDDDTTREWHETTTKSQQRRRQRQSRQTTTATTNERRANNNDERVVNKYGHQHRCCWLHSSSNNNNGHDKNHSKHLRARTHNQMARRQHNNNNSNKRAQRTTTAAALTPSERQQLQLKDNNNDDHDKSDNSHKYELEHEHNSTYDNESDDDNRDNNNQNDVWARAVPVVRHEPVFDNIVGKRQRHDNERMAHLVTLKLTPGLQERAGDDTNRDDHPRGRARPTTAAHSAAHSQAWQTELMASEFFVAPTRVEPVRKPAALFGYVHTEDTKKLTGSRRYNAALTSTLKSPAAASYNNKNSQNSNNNSNVGAQIDEEDNDESTEETISSTATTDVKNDKHCRLNEYESTRLRLLLLAPNASGHLLATHTSSRGVPQVHHDHLQLPTSGGINQPHEHAPYAQQWQQPGSSATPEAAAASTKENKEEEEEEDKVRERRKSYTSHQQRHSQQFDNELDNFSINDDDINNNNQNDYRPESSEESEEQHQRASVQATATALVEATATAVAAEAASNSSSSSSSITTPTTAITHNTTTHTGASIVDNGISIDGGGSGDGTTASAAAASAVIDTATAVAASKPALIGVLLATIIVVTFVGNVLVCVSVVRVRKLRTPSNYLLVSLAISDLCVATLVMPFAMYYELSTSGWQLGPRLCDLWVSFDVTSCTASILNLCTISVDRYLAITRPLTYGVKRTARHMFTLIFCVWCASCLISVPPLLISGNEYGTPSAPKCEVSQSLPYQLYATLGAFYIPLTIMICLYYKIYGAAKRVLEADARATVGRLVVMQAPLVCATLTSSNLGAPSDAATTIARDHPAACDRPPPPVSLSTNANLSQQQQQQHTDDYETNSTKKQDHNKIAITKDLSHRRFFVDSNSNSNLNTNRTNLNEIEKAKSKSNPKQQQQQLLPRHERSKQQLPLLCNDRRRFSRSLEAPLLLRWSNDASSPVFNDNDNDNDDDGDVDDACEKLCTTLTKSPTSNANGTIVCVAQTNHHHSFRHHHNQCKPRRSSTSDALILLRLQQQQQQAQLTSDAMCLAGVNDNNNDDSATSQTVINQQLIDNSNDCGYFDSGARINGVNQSKQQRDDSARHCSFQCDEHEINNYETTKTTAENVDANSAVNSECEFEDDDTRIGGQTFEDSTITTTSQRAIKPANAIDVPNKTATQSHRAQDLTLPHQAQPTQQTQPTRANCLATPEPVTLTAATSASAVALDVKQEETGERETDELSLKKQQLQLQQQQQLYAEQDEQRRRRTSSVLRERKASVTLGVIMTAFTVCWLPFFILAVLRPFWASVNELPQFVNTLTLWLGYTNSLLNPIIYVTFHHDFRAAFKHLLCCRCSTVNERIRKQEFRQNYGLASDNNNNSNNYNYNYNYNYTYNATPTPPADATVGADSLTHQSLLNHSQSPITATKQQQQHALQMQLQYQSLTNCQQQHYTPSRPAHNNF